ncbi:MAG: two-component system, OmpR family, sensor kinase [Miltoncostaeaceae bacterium]|nr:two-component system, OmpR family, sensor kinase [Miltoncostaeaceae bacterium]
MTRFRPRGLRTRLVLGTAIAMVLALAAATATFNVLLNRTLDRDARDLAHSRTAAGLAGLRVVDGRLIAPEAPDGTIVDAPLWVFSSVRTIEAPRAEPEVQQAARELASAGRGHLERVVDGTLLTGLPITAGGRRVGTVVAAVSLAPYVRTERIALGASLALAAVLLTLVVLGARWTIARALAPVARMTADAEAWGERDLDRRFDLGHPHDELTQLAATLDGLLDRLAASMRHEQRLTAEVSHELRTPLTKLITRAELTLRRSRDPEADRAAVEAMLEQARQLARTLETLLAAARHEARPSSGADATAAARAAVRAGQDLAAEMGISLRLEGAPEPLPVSVDADLLERVLEPLVENACRYGRGEAWVSVAREDGSVLIVIDDDGPGLAEGEGDRVFMAGVRGSAGAGRQHTSGVGLGLALARRLARAAGGEVEAEERTGGGRFVVRLPGG